jgi:hypothetical protein
MNRQAKTIGHADAKRDRKDPHGVGFFRNLHEILLIWAFCEFNTISDSFENVTTKPFVNPIYVS